MNNVSSVKASSTYSTNDSFIRLSEKLKTMGVLNHDIHMQVKDSRVTNLDPFSPNLSYTEKNLIRQECTNNIFYFLGECVRIPSHHPYPVRLELSVATLSMVLLSENNINSYTSTPRQTYRSITKLLIAIWYALFHGKKISIISFNTNQYYREKILAITKELPDYLNDVDLISSGSITISPNDKPVRADSSDIIVYDDFEFIKNGGEILDYNLAHKEALTIISSVAGVEENLNFKPLDIIESCTKWDIKFIDLDLTELKEYASKSSINTFYIEYLAEDIIDNADEWKRDMMRLLFNDEDIYNREVLLKRK